VSDRETAVPRAPARRLAGAPIARAVRARVRAVLEAPGPCPRLVNVVVGDDATSRSYLDTIDRVARKVGIDTDRVVLPADAPQASVLAALGRLAQDPGVSGVMVQSPLPAGLDARAVAAAIPPAKDVDGANPQSLGAVLSGRRAHLAPATAAAVVEILAASSDLAVAGRDVVVVGRSLVVGRPLAAMLAAPGPGGDGTVTLCHSRTRDLHAHTRRADVLVVAVGRPHLVEPSMVRPGAVVVDVGTNVGPDGGLLGDVHPEVAGVASALTPVPGGVGPVTNAVLMRHVAAAARPGAFAPAW